MAINKIDRPESFVAGTSPVLQYRVVANGVAQDISLMTTSFAAKANIDDTEHAIGPIGGTFISDGTDGEFQIALTGHIDNILDSGVYEILLIAAGGLTWETLTVDEGARISITQKIVKLPPAT
jgi:hypothetical protein